MPRSPPAAPAPSAGEPSFNFHCASVLPVPSNTLFMVHTGLVVAAQTVQLRPVGDIVVDRIVVARKGPVTYDIVLKRRIIDIYGAEEHIVFHNKSGRCRCRYNVRGSCPCYIITGDDDILIIRGDLDARIAGLPVAHIIL